MNYQASQSIEVCPVSPDDQPVALDLLFSQLTAEERNRQIEAILPELTSNELSREGLLGAYRNGVLVGAIFTQLLSGKNAQVWLPRLKPDECVGTADTLLRSTVEWLEKQQLCMAQMLLESVTSEDERIIRAGGFGYLTDLLYLVCLDDDFPKTALPCAVEFETYTPQNHERFVQILNATYEATLDCPKLNHVRQLEDVLEGYRAIGEFSPDRWLIVRYKTNDIGCLLLADHPQYENMELVYMGISPAVRGHRWGKDIARYAQWIARQAGRRRLVLAVDSSNQPAIDMYASVGFRAWDQRRIYYRIFS